MSGSRGSDEPWCDPTLVHDEWAMPSLCSESSHPGDDDQPDLPQNDAEPEADFIWDFHDTWKGDEWVGPDIASDVPTPEEAGARLTELLLEKFNSGKWLATDVCKTAYWAAHLGGVKGPVDELAKRPGLPSSHYSRHLKQVLGLVGNDETLQHLSILSSDSVDGSRINYALPVLPPHEMLNTEIADHPGTLATKLAEFVRDDKLPPVYMDHPVAKASGYTAQPIALYVDGVPTTNRDGVIGIWVYFMLSSQRHLVAVLKKSKLCKCGCLGWCTLFIVFSWLNWSFVCMATGEHPDTCWDGSPHEDFLRRGLVGTSLLFSACVCAIKGDWMEFCSTFWFQ